MTRIAVLSLGGTIAMTPTSSGGVAPALDADDLIAAVPALSKMDVEIDARSLRSLPSASIGFADLVVVQEAIMAAVADGADGVVITQGTDTIEETAFFCDITVDCAQPVVVTGAMRHPTMPGADGPANLLAAVSVAAHPDTRDLGTVVVMSDEVHAARLVHKTHTASTATFASPGFGPLGHLVEGRPRLLTTPRRLPRVRLDADVARLRVALVTMSLGDDGELLRAVDDRFAGAVIAGLGAGHVPESVVAAITDMAARMPVVLASRCGAGSMLTHTYGYPGSEIDLLDRGLTPAGFLDPYKSRILLQVLLAAQTPQAQIAAAFDAYR